MKAFKHRIGLVCGCGLLIVFAASAISAQSTQGAKGSAPTAERKVAKGPQLSGSDQGTFRIIVDGQPKGTEEYQIEPSGDHFISKGTVHLTVTRGDKPVNYLIASELLLKPNYDPIQYSLVEKYEDNVATIKMTFQNGKAAASFDTGSGVEKRNYEFPAGVAVLDDNVFHHYALLAQRYDYDRGGLQEFYAFIPQESVGGILRITLKGDEKVEVNGKSIAVQHLLVDTKDLQLDLYVEGDHHRLVKLVVPSSDVVVERTS